MTQYLVSSGNCIAKLMYRLVPVSEVLEHHREKALMMHGFYWITKFPSGHVNRCTNMGLGPAMISQPNESLA